MGACPEHHGAALAWLVVWVLQVDSILQALLAEQRACEAPEQGQELGQQWTGTAAQQSAQARRQALVQRMEALEASFIAHQCEEEANVLPRIATALPGRLAVGTVRQIERWLGRIVSCVQQLLDGLVPALLFIDRWSTGCKLTCSLL